MASPSVVAVFDTFDDARAHGIVWLCLLQESSRARSLARLSAR
ncbi:MAG: hypothetical protein OXM88_17895 [bacterium]|nr:hypothetical protein [bacterium]